MPFEIEPELAALKEKLLLMASYAESAVTRAVKALIRRDDDLARRTKEGDSLIDQLEVEIDEAAMHLLERELSHQDLRLVAMVMKISHDLERVGDEATTISRRCMELSREPQLRQSVDLPQMAAAVVQMLKDSLDAFVGKDPEKARGVIACDAAVDDLNRALHRDLADLMVREPHMITRALNLMVISKSLERIGDHATNVAEVVVYLSEGRDIRHSS